MSKKTEYRGTGLKGIWAYLAFIGAVFFFFIFPILLINFAWPLYTSIFSWIVNKISYPIILLLMLLGFI